MEDENNDKTKILKAIFFLLCNKELAYSCGVLCYKELASTSRGSFCTTFACICTKFFALIGKLERLEICQS